MRRRRLGACLVLTAATPFGCGSGGVDPAVLERGEEVYQGHCLGCHQASGRGVPRMTPPLVDSEWVSGDPERLIRVVLAGLEGPIEVGGERFQGVMGAQAYLSDEDVAAVLSYVRHRFAPQSPPIRPARVAEVRAELADGGAAD